MRGQAGEQQHVLNVLFVFRALAFSLGKPPMARRKIEIPTLMGAEATGASAIARLSSFTKIGKAGEVQRRLRNAINLSGADS